MPGDTGGEDPGSDGDGGDPSDGSGSGGSEIVDKAKPALGHIDESGVFVEGELSLTADEVIANSTLFVNVGLIDRDQEGTISSWDAPASVSFTSICAKQEWAEIEDEIDLDGGQGAASYVVTNPNCKKDTITATVTIDGKQLVARTKEFEISHSQPGSVQFLGADEEKISLKGASVAGLAESAELTFVVLDRNGKHVGAGQEVNFEKESALGGLSINRESATTNRDGEVTVRVTAGSVPHVAVIRAKVKFEEHDANGDPIEVTVFGDGKLPVSVGVITQDAFNLVVSELNPLAWDTGGVTVEITALGADRRGSPADGTTIFFNSKLGNIDPPECTIANGSCSVTWTSHAAQPIRFDSDRKGSNCLSNTIDAYDKGVLRAIDCFANSQTTSWTDRFGRNVVTAYAAGEESFRDKNDNNVFDVDEFDTLKQLPERIFYDFNTTGIEDGVDEHHLVPNFQANTFHGVGCSEAAISEGHCKNLTQVRRSVVFVLSSERITENTVYVLQGTGSVTPNKVVAESDGDPANEATLTFDGFIEVQEVNHAGGKLHMVMHDFNGNSPGVGASIEVESEAMEVTTNCGTVTGRNTEFYTCSADLSGIEWREYVQDFEYEVEDENGDKQTVTGTTSCGTFPDPNFAKGVKVTFKNATGELEEEKPISINIGGASPYPPAECRIN